MNLQTETSFDVSCWQCLEYIGYSNKTVKLYMNPLYKLFILSGKLGLKNHILPSRGMLFFSNRVRLI